MSLGPTVSVYKFIPTLDNIKSLYTLSNKTIGANLQTGSSSIDVSGYGIKTIFGYIHTTQDASGSLVVSGSFDNVTYFQYKTSAVFNSGSTGSTINIEEALPYISVHLKNSVTGSAVSGSLYLSVKY